MKRSDIWTIFLICLYAFLLPKIAGVGQSLLMNNSARGISLATPQFWIRTGLTSLCLVFFFVNVFQIKNLITTPEKNFEAQLIKTITALAWFFCLFLILSLFPQFTTL